MKAAQTSVKLYHDRTARRCTFAVGDNGVLLRSTKHNKLEVQREGPAELVRKLSDTTTW